MSNGNGNGSFLKWIVGVMVGILFLFVGTAINLAGNQMNRLEDDKVDQSEYNRDREYLHEKLEDINKSIQSLRDSCRG